MHKPKDSTFSQEQDMAIATAIETAGVVNVYDETGGHIFSKTGSLHGFTNSSVSILQKAIIHVYDDKGEHRFSRSS
jgi:hypothetical protein